MKFREGEFNVLRKAQLYFHTLRYLKPVQIWGRVTFLLVRPEPDLNRAPLRASSFGPWHMPARRLPSMTSPRSWVFLNEAGHLAELDWDGPQREMLWRYNQHYFDDLNAIDAATRFPWHKSLLVDWVEHNPPVRGVGWEPYPTSLRIVNWVKWTLAGNELPEPCIQSLAVQARWLSQRLEIHLLGNHLFTNAKALVFAGLFFAGQEASAWLSQGLKILEREILEQILSDGGQYERSTMYHSLAYEDMLDLINMTSAFPEACLPWAGRIADWPRIAERMGYWLRVMCHPDGEIALFNDAAFGIAPTPEELFFYAERLNCSPPPVCNDVVHLEASGYIRISIGSAVLLIDVAPVGPDYLPGHAHADTLSFELSLNSQRIVVNGGTSRYGVGQLRDNERATNAHSTVEINGQNSSEVWAGFRVARRANPFDVNIKRNSAGIIVEAAHDGYKRLRGRPIHRRRWVLCENSVEIIDYIEGRFSEAVARIHLHPDVLIEAESFGGRLSWRGGNATWKAQTTEIHIAKLEWHPRFGISVEAECLELRVDPYAPQPSSRFALNWC